MHDQAVPILYSFRRCPYAMRARLAIASQSIRVELREVVLKNKPSEMLALSPKATVPVLQLADGTVIEESLDVMRWAFADSAQNPAFNEREATLIQLNDGAFKAALDRYKYQARQEMKVEGKTAADFRNEALEYLQQFEQYFTENRERENVQWAILPFVRQFRGVDELWFDQLELPALHHCLQGFLVSSRFRGVMKKYPPWQAEQAPLLTHFEEITI